jgi:serine/threonine protein kinase
LNREQFFSNLQSAMDQVLGVMNEPIDPICPKCGAKIPEGAPHGLCPKCVMADVSEATQEDTRMSKGLEAPDSRRLAEAFPDLEIKELIGQGGMGFVYRARQSKLDRDVALKVLPESLAKDPAFAERFSREGRLLAKLNHNNIVTVFDFGQSGPFFFLLMEFVDGVNLRQAMRAGKFTPEQALSVVPKFCEALQYAHDQDVLHRDIKPENILMDARGQVKIADFGIAKMVGDSTTNSGLTVSGANIGTPHYMAPEQVESASKVDHRADIYSLGVVFYELLTGELPIGRFEAPSNRTTLDTRLDDIVLRALEKDRERRQQRADEIKTQVENLSEPGSGPISGAHSDQKSHLVARNRTLAPAIGLGLVALICFIRSFLIPELGGAPGAISISGTTPLGSTLSERLFTPSGVINATIIGFLCFAALTLYRVENRGVALLGGMIAFITFPWTLIGFPIGIWVLNVLHSPAVKEAFPDYRPQVKPAHDGNPWPHRIFWLIITIVVVPIVLLVTSLSVAWLSYRDAEAPAPSTAKQIEAQSSNGGEMKAELEGGSLSLLGISNSLDESPIWIKPDETPLIDIQLDSSDIKVTAQSGESGYEFLIKKASLPPTTKVMTWNATPNFSTLAQGTPKRDGIHDPSLILLAGTWPNHIREVDLKALIATGEFTTLASCKADAVSNDSYSHQAGAAEGKEWEITFSCPHHDDESTVVALAHNYEEGEIRLVAQSSDGSIHTATKGQTGSQHLTAVFEGLDIIDIERFMAQIRPFKTINFSSVKLPIRLETK